MAEARTTQPRGPVSEEQRLCLRRNAEFLKDEMDTGVLVSHLHTRLILDTRDMQDLSGISTQHQKNAMLIDIIAMRTPKGFEAFLCALQATGHQAAYDRITTTLADIHDFSKGTAGAQIPGNRIIWDGIGTDSDGVFLTEASIDAAPDLMGPVDKPSDTEIMDILQRLATSLLEPRNDEDEETLDKLKQAFKTVESRLVELTQELKARETLDAQKEQELSRLQQQLTEANQEIARLRAKDEQTSKQLAEVQLKNKELLATVAQLRSENEALLMRIDQLENRMDHERGELYSTLGQGQQHNLGLPALRRIPRGSGHTGVKRFQGDPPPNAK